jgi:glycine oxidase
MALAAAARDDLRARAEALIPGLKDWTLAEHWAGLRPASPDGLPLLGRLANGVFVAAGQYRNGILFAPAIADHLRDLVLDRAAVIPEFDPRRFP